MAANEKDAAGSDAVASGSDVEKQPESDVEGKSSQPLEDQPPQEATAEPEISEGPARDSLEASDDSSNVAESQTTDGEPEMRESDDASTQSQDTESPDTTVDTTEPQTGDADLQTSTADKDTTEALAEETADPAKDPYASERDRQAEETVQEEYHDEPEGSSFAAKALTFLIILIIGAGLGIWGAPRLAPMLPAGMAPVAAWLSPSTSSEAEDQLAELTQRLDALTAQIETLPTSDVTSEDVSSAVASARDALDGEIAALQSTVEALQSSSGDSLAALQTSVNDQVSALQTSVSALQGSDMAEQVSSLQSAIEGQASEMASLRDQLSSANASSDSGAQIDVYEAELEGLRGEVRNLTERVTGLGGRIDEVAETADQSINAAEAKVGEIQKDAEDQIAALQASAQSQVAALEAQAEEKVAEIQEQAQQMMDGAAIDADIAIIRGALSAGQPFKDAADRLSAADNVSMPASLAAVSETGVSTMQGLRDRFSTEAHGAIRATIEAEAEGEGFLERSRAYLEAQLATRSLSPQDGAHVDAVLSRMEDSLKKGDLSAALTEAEQLPDEAKSALSAWIQDAQARLDADQGLAEIQSNQQTAEN
ncbi:MAG: mitofilin family membrane protein [Pseudomonadota bacterium]